MSEKQAWYGAVLLTAAGTQMPKYMDHRRQCVSCRLPVVERTDALSSLTSPESQDISLDSAHNIVQDQTVNKIVCVLGAKEPHRKLQSSAYGTLMHLTCYSNQQEQFLQCVVTVKHGLITLHPQKWTRTWKHPSSVPSKDIKSKPFFETIKVCCLLTSLTVVALQLLGFIVVHLLYQDITLTATSGSIRPTGLLFRYDAMARRLWTTLHTVLISCPLICCRCQYEASCHLVTHA